MKSINNLTAGALAARSFRSRIYYICSSSTIPVTLNLRQSWR
uniref:Uncharacterized protein n=1 Tax=Siphoviridae sp. cttqT1 TaxID=2827961 RepID=A0A8S5TP15_9CAUD|nr:MAG TPA: hypothetical protein [Siphoviridae sp. cttqT1]